MTAKKKTKPTRTKPSTPSTTAAPSASPPSSLTREAALHSGRIVKLPGHMRTKDDIERELDALPAHFPRTKIPPLVMLREAEELVRRRDDVPMFAARGIAVTAGHFQYIADLCAFLRDAAGIREVAGAAHSGYAALENAYADQLRRDARRLRLLAELNGLSPQLATLGDSSGNLRLMEAASSITARLTPYLELFEQEADARALVAQLEQTVSAMTELRAKQAEEAGVEHEGTDRVHRIKRLLLDALRYVGIAGQYVFDDDPARAAAYHLQHVLQYTRPKKQKAPPATSTPMPAPFAARPPADA